MSAWREFNFAYNQVKRTVEPHLAVNDMIVDWNKMSKFLAERQRSRKS